MDSLIPTMVKYPLFILPVFYPRLRSEQHTMYSVCTATHHVQNVIISYYEPVASDMTYPVDFI